MQLSDDVIRVWMGDVRRYLRRYFDHPHFDDIVAEAYLTMWEALTAADENQVRDVKAFAMRAAWYGAQNYLSSPRNDARTYNVFKKKAVTPLLSLEGVIAGHYEEWTPSRMREPDFVPLLIERIAAEQELAKLSPARRTAILLCAYHGLTRREACEQLGWSRTRIDYYLRGISRDAVPSSHPGPGAPKNWHLRERNERGQFAS